MADLASPPSITQIQSWIAYEEERLREIRINLDSLRAAERQVEERLGGLRQLRAAYAPASEAADGERSLDPGPTRSVMETVRERVTQILLQSDGPMHINDIHRAFGERGWPVPGAGKAANITAHLSHAPGIVSPTRGYYRLRAEHETADEARRSRTQNRTARASSKRK